MFKRRNTIFVASRFLFKFTHEEAAKQTLEEVCKRGADGCIIKADVSKPEEVKKMVQLVMLKYSL